jgi:hypothetical protein
MIFMGTSFLSLGYLDGFGFPPLSPRARGRSIPENTARKNVLRRSGKFSNDWKLFFQWLENSGRFFQRLEKIFGSFPMIGKNFRDFSNDWKIFFQWLENFGAASRWGCGR